MEAAAPGFEKARGCVPKMAGVLNLLLLGIVTGQTMARCAGASSATRQAAVARAHRLGLGLHTLALLLRPCRNLLQAWSPVIQSAARAEIRGSCRCEMYTEADTPRLYPESRGVLHACRRASPPRLMSTLLYQFTLLSKRAYLHDPPVLALCLHELLQELHEVPI